MNEYDFGLIVQNCNNCKKKEWEVVQCEVPSWFRDPSSCDELPCVGKTDHLGVGSGAHYSMPQEHLPRIHGISGGKLT